MKITTRISSDFILVEDLAIVLETKTIDNKVSFPPKYGNGYLQGFSFPHEISLYLYDFSLSIPWEVTTYNPVEKGGYCIFMNLLSNNVQKTIGKKKVINISKDSSEGVFFYSPGTSAQVNYPINERFQLVAVTFSADFIKSILGEGKLLEALSAEGEFVFFHELTLLLEQHVHNSFKKRNSAGSDRVDLLIDSLSIIKMVLRNTFEANQGINLMGIHSEDVESIFQVRKEIIKNLDNTPKLSELAQKAGMSESKLIKLFKKVFGRPVYQYAQYAKIMKAKELLSTGNYNISEVGYKVGYTNISHFGEAFKKYLDMNPSDYVKMQVGK